MKNISLDELKYMNVDHSVNKVYYGGGDFDDWLIMVKHIFPNIKKVVCRDFGLTSIVCKGIKSLDCSGNNLTVLVTDAKYVNCNNNNLTHLNLPNSTIIICNNNQLQSIRCNIAKYLECNNNNLTNLYCPEASCLIAKDNNLRNVYSPIATIIEITDNPDVYSPMVKLLFRN